MTPPVVDGTLPRTLAPRVPRRVSGPARSARAGAVRSPDGRTRPAPTPRAATAGRIRRRRWLIALPRLAARFAVALPDARALDRLIRGRAWIAIVACALVGIVYLQVSLLGMNAQITRAVATAQTLETQNTIMQGQIASAGAGGRVQDAAGRAGMVLPPAAWASYDAVRGADAARAAVSIRPPDPAAEQRNAAANAALAPPIPTLSPQDAQGAVATSPAIAPSASGVMADATGSGTSSTDATGTDAASTATATPAAVTPAAVTPTPAVAATPPPAAVTPAAVTPAPSASAPVTPAATPVTPAAPASTPVTPAQAASSTGGATASVAGPG